MENILKVKMVKIKVKIKEFISNFKKRIKEHFLLKVSLSHLMEIAKDFYFVSIGINEINNGINNPKRFRMTTLHLIYFAIYTFVLLLFSSSNYLILLLKTDLLIVLDFYSTFRMVVVGYTIGVIWILAIKIDMILAEINFNLSPLKVFFFLINNLKSKHKLIGLNYNRLAILSRIIIFVAIDYGIPSVVSFVMGFCVLIGILSQKFVWILFSIAFYLQY